jgi:hypothetical protein
MWAGLHRRFLALKGFVSYQGFATGGERGARIMGNIQRITTNNLAMPWDAIESFVAKAKWKAEVHARIQGLGYAMGTMKRQEEANSIERKQERNTVQAQGWAGDGAEEKDEDEKCEKGNNMVVKKDACVKENNMVVRKNSKKKMDVAKEENGERLIK